MKNPGSRSPEAGATHRIAHPSRGRITAMIVALLAAVTLAPSISPAAIAAAPPTVTLTPTGPLVDGQQVRVDISGAQDRGIVRIAQCVLGSDNCREEAVISDLPDSGSTSVELWVVAIVNTTDCRVAPGCDLNVIVEQFGPEGTSQHRIALPFDPTADLRPLPSVTVTPSTGLDLGDMVRVDVTGLDPWRDPSPVAQCRADDITLSGCDIEAHSTDHWHNGTLGFTIEWGVGTIIQTTSGDFDCRTAPGACVLATPVRIPPDDTSRPVAVPLTFVPGAAAGYPTGGTGAQPPTPPPIPPTPTPQPPPDPALLTGRYLAEVFDDVDAVRDIVIWPDAPPVAGSSAPTADITIDILMPAGDTIDARPVVLASPGEGFETLVARGYVVVTQELRDISVSGVAQQQAMVDRAAAVRWLRAHAKDFRLHREAIVVAGSSFRGTAALAMAWGWTNTADEFEWPFPAPPGAAPGPWPLPGDRDLGPVNREQPSTVAAAVAHIAWFPPELIDAGEAPAILHNGTRDEIFPYPEVEKICPAASDLGVTCELWAYDSDHRITAEDRPVADDRTALFLYAQVLEPLGLVAGEPATTTAAAPIATQPGFTG